MIDTWFTADTHFGHANILNYEKEARPFSTLDEMHEVMIERWNSVVKSKDIVYHLGDFAFGKHWLAIAARLNGEKRLVMGNHDTYPSHLYLEHFSKLYGAVFWNRCILSHIPVNPFQLCSARWKLNVHGHLHSKNIERISEMTFSKTEFGSDLINSWPWSTEKDPHYFCVSVEQNNLTPFHADDIKKRLEDLK